MGTRTFAFINGDSIFCPVRVVGRRFVYVRSRMNNDWSTPIHAYWDEDGQRKDVTDSDIRKALKEADTLCAVAEQMHCH